MTKKSKFSEKGKSILNRDKLTNLSDFFSDSDTTDDLEIKQIPINLIMPNPNQARKYFNDSALKDLSLSIQENGVIQPILVRKNESNEILLVAGERRLRASNSLGLKTIPAIFTSGNPLEISLIENIQRENLSPIEEAEAFNQMVSQFKYTQQQLAKVVGKARSTIAETLSLNKLPDSIKQNSRHADISKRTLIEVAKVKDHNKMITLYEKISSEKLSSDSVRKITRKPKTTVKKPAAVLKIIKAATKELTDLHIKDLTEKEYLKLIEELDRLKSLLNDILS